MQIAEEDLEYPVRELVFGVCSKSTDDTFRLFNLDMKFIGEEEVVDGEHW